MKFYKKAWNNSFLGSSKVSYFRKSFYLNSVHLKEAIIFLADVRSGSLDLVTFVEELG